MPVDERGQPEVRADAVVGQRFHQRQRNAGGQRRPRQRQRHLAHAPPQAGAEQPRRFHQLHTPARPARRASAGRRTGTAHSTNSTIAPRQAAHVGPQRASRAGGRAQRGLQRAAELQQVGVGVGQHVGRHRQRQQQRPLEDAPAAESRTASPPPRSPRRRSATPIATHSASSSDSPHVAGQHGLRTGAAAPPAPGASSASHDAEHAEHRQRRAAGSSSVDAGGASGRRGRASSRASTLARPHRLHRECEQSSFRCSRYHRPMFLQHRPRARCATRAHARPAVDGVSLSLARGPDRRADRPVGLRQDLAAARGRRAGAAGRRPRARSTARC